MSHFPDSDWLKWFTPIFDDSTASSQAVKDAWTEWLAGLINQENSNSVRDEWVEAARLGGQHANRILKRARAFLNENNGHDTQAAIEELRRRLDRIEAVLPENSQGCEPTD